MKAMVFELAPQSLDVTVSLRVVVHKVLCESVKYIHINLRKQTIDPSGSVNPYVKNNVTDYIPPEV